MRSVLACSILLLAFLLVGCKAKPVEVRGVVSKDGRPVQVPKNLAGMIVFEPAEGSTGLKGWGAPIDKTDGSFAFTEGRKLLPGQYVVTLSAQVVGSNDDHYFGGQFGTDNSPLRYLVTEAEAQEITVDTTQKTVVAK